MTARSSSLHLTGAGFAAPLAYAPAAIGKAASRLIGDEPPMAPGSETEFAAAPLHGINLRWLAGTVLAGVGGMSLVGASLLIALDGEANFASRAKLAVVRNGGGGGQESPDHGTKGDKIVATVDIGGAKLVAKLPDTIRVGDREIIKARQFTRVTTAISLASPNVADEIPAYNPLKMVTGPAVVAQRTSDDQAGEATADVSMIRRTLSSEDGVAFFQASLSDDDAKGQLPAPAASQQPAPSTDFSMLPSLINHRVASPNADSNVLGYAPADSVSRFSSIDVRVVPENVVTITKLDDRTPRTGGTERVIVAKHGDTFEQILRNNGATSDQIKQIQAILAPKTRDYQVTIGQRLRLLVASDRSSHKGDELLRVVIYGDDQINAIAAVDDSGVFRSVVPPSKAARAKAGARATDDDEDEDSGGPTLYEGLYETALKNGIPRATIDDLVRIFAYDVDFQRKAQQTDSFDVLYVKDDENSDSDHGDILYAALTTGDETRKLYRYQTKDDGQIDYFDDGGKSAKKFLLRKPIAGGRFSSSYGYRYHPILGYGRMHTGVDWADKVGTPIFSAGNGVVLKASWDSGYGNRVEIQHNNGWITTYNHMSAYAKGVTPGTKVKQGQVLGFIGSTGLSTGAHLHYEVIVNGNFVDPLRVKLPRGRELDGKLLADFGRERQHDDELLGRISDPARIAQSAAN